MTDNPTAEFLKDHLIKVGFSALAMMSWTSTVYGCAPCLVFWVDNRTCWLCDEEGILLAEPANKEQLFRQQHNRST